MNAPGLIHPRAIHTLPPRYSCVLAIVSVVREGWERWRVPHAHSLSALNSCVPQQLLREPTTVHRSTPSLSPTLSLAVSRLTCFCFPVLVMFHLSSLYAALVFVVLLYTAVAELCTGTWTQFPSSVRLRQLRAHLRQQLILYSGNPFAASPSYNLGVSGFRYQLVNLIAHHQQPFNALMHDLTLPVDGAAHLVVSTAFVLRLTEDTETTSAVLLGALALLCYQTTTYGNKVFSGSMVAVYAAIGWAIMLTFASVSATTALTSPVVRYCQLWLLLSASLRALGHVIDDCPPYLILGDFHIPASASALRSESPHCFRPFSHYLRSGFFGLSYSVEHVVRTVCILLRLVLTGYLSEFQAGFTWRLFHISCYHHISRAARAVSVEAERAFAAHGGKPSLTLADYEIEAHAVKHRGFKHSELTQHIFDWLDTPPAPSAAIEPAAVQPVSATSVTGASRKPVTAPLKADEHPTRGGDGYAAHTSDCSQDTVPQTPPTQPQAVKPCSGSPSASNASASDPDATLLWVELVHFLLGLCGAAFSPRSVVEAYSIHYSRSTAASADLSAYEFVQVVCAFYAAVCVLLYLLLSSNTLRTQAPLLRCLHAMLTVFYATLLAYDAWTVWQFVELMHSQRLLTATVHAAGFVMHSARWTMLGAAGTIFVPTCCLRLLR